MDTPLPTSAAFRYPLPGDEDLPALARLAHGISASECGSCRNYHIVWPYLRAIGANGNGPESAWEEQSAILARAAAGRDKVRWLIAGAADSGVLALVRNAIRAVPASHSVTVVDRCGTPLALCRAYAEATGLPVETVRSDLIAFSRQAAFDVVFLHHVLMFFDPEGRVEMLRAVRRWLAAGGAAVIAFPDKVTAQGRAHRHRRAWQRQAMEVALATGQVVPPEDAASFVGRFDDRGKLKSAAAQTTGWGVAEHLEAMAAADLVVTEKTVLPPPAGEAETLGAAPDPRIACLCHAAP